MSNNLPYTCFVLSDKDDQLVSIVRGTTGYFPTIYSGDKAKQLVDELNTKLGVSKAQAAAMYHGSMFGWDTPGSNPEFYDENGCPIHKTAPNNGLIQVQATINVDRETLLAETEDTCEHLEEAINQEFGWLNNSGMRVVAWEFLEEGTDASDTKADAIKNSTKMENIYTHDEAASIIEVFEDLLSAHDIKVPSPEDDEREDDNDAAFYGSVYSNLLDQVETILIKMLERGRNAAVISHEFSGTF